MQIENRITGKTRLAAVIGNPIEHSISPQLHNTLSRQLGIDLAYVAMRIEREHLEDAIKGFLAMGFLGFNVTIPYKTEIVKYMDELSEEASIAGAVNTVKIHNGRFIGYNTDGDGFLRSFMEETGKRFRGKVVTVLGAGGGARSVSYKAASEEPARLYILNRTVSKAAELCSIVAQKTGVEAHSADISGEEAAEIIGSSDIIINTTSAGMFPDTENMPVDESVKFRAGQIVYDIIYNPEKTMLLKKAEESGCLAVNGLGMLIYQGITAYEIWTGIKVPVEICRQLADEFKKFRTKKGICPGDDEI